MYRSLLVSSLLSVAAAAPSRRASADPVVSISQGTVQGTATSAPGAAATVNKYLGIPFAVTPPERFSPPQAVKASNATLQATTLPPACYQQFNQPEESRELTIATFGSPLPPSESEDCLYINVFTPSKEPPAGGFPVMFWLYGGNLQFGYSGLPFYDGSYFAGNQSVVVAVPNYRTNVFGFPNAPQLPVGEQNPGFLDQRQALSWVNKNIKAFGGDPSQVTIFGESAGGYSVKQLIAVPPKNPENQFRAAILESEALAAGNGTAAWDALIASLNCTTSDTLACARAAPATTLKSIIEEQALAFVPVPDDITQSKNVSLAIISGTAADVPILIGTNQDDGSFFALEYPDASVFAPFLPYYPDAQFPSNQSKVGAIITDETFQCPAATIANLTSAHRQPTFRYLYNATFLNVQPPIPGVINGTFGAWHTSEIPEVFGTYPREDSTMATQEALSQNMNTAWANFAKDPTKSPLEGWPEVGSAVDDIYTFQSTGDGLGPVVSPADVDFRCPIYAGVIAATGV